MSAKLGVIITNQEESKAVQEAMFSIGWAWASGLKTFMDSLPLEEFDVFINLWFGNSTGKTKAMYYTTKDEGDGGYHWTSTTRLSVDEFFANVFPNLQAEEALYESSGTRSDAKR